jgi:hypothetical protein
MLMHRYGGPPPSGWASPIPRRSLRDFARVSVTKGGGSAQLGFSVPQQALALTAHNGDLVLLAGPHELLVYTNGSSPAFSVKVQVPSTTILEVVPKPS